MKSIRIKDFLQNEVKEFSLYDCYRSIPNIVDGLKPSQRKVIYGLQKKGENTKEIKVAQLGSYVAEVTHYNHGEDSLSKTIVGLARDYAGSNNMNLLKPEGTFGNRSVPEAAAGRYIYTEFTENFRKLFKKDDELIFTYVEEDGYPVEPLYYMPILPPVLINGASGTGTGFACEILLYNPNDLKKYTENYLKGKHNKNRLIPWYRGFNGEITKNDEGQVVFKGKLQVVNTTNIEITELPIGYSLEKYKEILNKLIDEEFIKDYTDLTKNNTFHIKVQCPRTTTALDEDELYRKFKLFTRETENFTVWLENGKIKKFDSPELLLEYFVDLRLGFYEDRRVAQIAQLAEYVQWLDEKLRFINFYISNSHVFSNNKKEDLYKLLEKEKFVNIDKLLDIRIYNLTLEQIQKLKDEIEEVLVKIDALTNTTPDQMYLKELSEFTYSP